MLRVRTRSLACALGVLSLFAALCFCAPAIALTHFKYEEALSTKLSEGLPGAAFVQPTGLTFDAAGNLFIADAFGSKAKEGIIDKFNDEEALQGQLDEGDLSNYTRGVAVSDESGHIYVADSPLGGGVLHPEIHALGPAGELLSTWTGAGTEPKTFGESYVYDAVDNSPSVAKGDVYVMVVGFNGHASEVDVFKPKSGDKEEGELLRRLAAPGGFKFEADDGLAVDQANGDVYVVDSGHKVVDRFSPTGVYEASAQLTGAPNEEGTFEQFAIPHAVAVDAATGDVFVIDEHLVDAFSASGKFEGRISETGANEPFGQPVGVAVQQSGPYKGDIYVTDEAKAAVDVFAGQEPLPPGIEGEAITHLEEESVDFAAEINPHEAPSEYHFEYGRCAAAVSCAESPYEHTLPQPDATLGFEDDQTHTSAPIEVTGLAPGSTYHMRVIAHSIHGQSIGEERVFTTKSPSGALTLPDGRAWELVSPPDKLGGR